MAVIEDLSEEEAYLWTILSDPSGLDQAELTWYDPENDDGCFRAWAFQWKWWRSEDAKTIDQCARSVGKTKSIMVRACAFPFLHPRQEMVITAPEGVHLDAVTDNIETQITSTRLLKSMLNRERGKSAIKHKPFHINFQNGSRIMGRIPQRDGKGMKGVHPLWLELDEGQDYPEPGWKETIETLKRGSKGAVWRAHGVTRGVRDEFYRLTQPNSGWKVFRYCLPGDTLIYGVNGPVKISEITPGTEVWSVNPSGNLVKDRVTDLIDNGERKIWNVSLHGGHGLRSTGNHPYLCLSRSGTRKTRRELQFQWIEARDLVHGDIVVCLKSLPECPRGKVDIVGDISRMLHDKSTARRVPEWVWGAGHHAQKAFLAGYLMGDGTISRQERGQNPWQIGTSSREMAKELRALCHYLGLRTSNIGMNTATQNHLANGPQYRFWVYEWDSWFRSIPTSYSVHDLPLGDHLVARTVVSVEESDVIERTWDITVGDTHNFVAEGVVVHNTAMHRPNWTDQEREEKILDYGGSPDHPDYKRNVLGLHGDATNPLFVLHRLMACVDQVKSSDYNLDVYYSRKISDEEVQDRGGLIAGIVDIPSIHKQLCRVFWIGMDVGFTNHPSEILVFGEIKPSDLKKAGIVGEDGTTALPKGDGVALILLTRLKLDRIAHPQQVDLIQYLVDYYRPVAFSMDKTGNGLPLFQDVQQRSKRLAETIKGYNFSEKILVDFDLTVDVDEFKGDVVEDSGIKKNVLEYSSDVLRDYVDHKRLVLPFDRELIGEFEGQTYYVVRDTMNQYGKREFNKGKFHALDAAKMAVLGAKQHSIEEFTKKDKFEPAPTIFF